MERERRRDRVEGRDGKREKEGESGCGRDGRWKAQVGGRGSILETLYCNDYYVMII